MGGSAPAERRPAKPAERGERAPAEPAFGADRGRPPEDQGPIPPAEGGSPPVVAPARWRVVPEDLVLWTGVDAVALVAGAAGEAEGARAVEEALAEAGWLDARLAVEPPAGEGPALLRVETGERWSVGAVRFEGHSALTAEALGVVAGADAPEAGPGRPATRAARESLRWAVERAYARAGHLAAVEVEPVHDRATRRVDLVVSVAEGPPRVVRTVEVAGDDDTERWLLDRRIPVVPGERFDRDGVDEGAEGLRGTGWYDEVVPEVEPEGEDGVRVRYRVVPARTGSFALGAGWAQDDEVAHGGAQVVERNFSLSGLLGDLVTPDLDRWFHVPRGGGETLDARWMEEVDSEGRLGARWRTAALRWERPLRAVPLGMGSDLSQFVAFERSRRGFDGYVRDDLEVSFGQDLLCHDALRLGVAGGIGFARLVDVEPDTPAVVHDSAPRYDRNRVGLALDWDSWRGGVDGSGWIGHAEGDRHGGALGGVDLSRAEARLEHRRAVAGAHGAGAHILAAGGGARWVEEHSGTDTVPVGERLFAGGSAGPRGFEYLAVGPRTGGHAVGGEAALEAGCSYEAPLVTTPWRLAWRGGPFVEAATVAEDARHLRSDRVRVGAGVAVHVDLGREARLGAYLATPVVREPGDQGREVGIAFGLPF